MFRHANAEGSRLCVSWSNVEQSCERVRADARHVHGKRVREQCDICKQYCMRPAQYLSMCWLCNSCMATHTPPTVLLSVSFFLFL